MKITIDKSNLKIEEAIKKMPELKTKMLEQACLIVEADAKQKCPVSTGTLRRSINHQVDGDTGIVKSNEEYAPYVEIGTGRYSSQGSGRTDPWKYQAADGTWYVTSGQRPQPFLKPAAEDNKSEIINAVIEVFNGA